MIADDVPVNPASTVMLARDRADADGIEVFMVRRNAGAAFAAGMFVFPGGRVDDADGAPEIARYVGGIDDAAASTRLGVDRGGLAYWVAAIRESFEEAGLLLARAANASATAASADDRRAVHRGDMSMIELCRRRSLLLDAGALRYVAHWVTPVGETPRRFDTRFFLAAAPDGQHGAHDEVETVDSRWVRPDQALASARRGELMLMPPTMANLQLIAGAESVTEALARADAAGPPPRIQPKIRRNGAGDLVGFSMPGDADYDELV